MMRSLFNPLRNASSAYRRNKRQIHYDVVIVGGGVMGSSSAYFLKSKDPSLKVAIVERDITWSREFLNNAHESLTIDPLNPVNVGLVNAAYVFTSTKKGLPVLENNWKTQRSCGVDVHNLSPCKLSAVLPWLNMDGIAGGTMTTNGSEGWFDGWSLLVAFQKKAVSLGVDIIQGACTGIDVTSNVNAVKVATDDGELQLECLNMVNAAGCWAGHLMELINIYLPVYPHKKCIYVLDCPRGPGRGMPLLVDPSGFHIRPEGGGTLYLCGESHAENDEPNISDQEFSYAYFRDVIWPNLAHRIPVMEDLKLKHAWAGYYDCNTFDQNAIIGNHPEVENLYFINGFSGHGMMQSPAAGNAISELIIERKFSAVDLWNLNYDRITGNKQMLEKSIL